MDLVVGLAWPAVSQAHLTVVMKSAVIASCKQVDTEWVILSIGARFWISLSCALRTHLHTRLGECFCADRWADRLRRSTCQDEEAEHDLVKKSAQLIIGITKTIFDRSSLCLC
jgi:hypothetical protein